MGKVTWIDDARVGGLGAVTPAAWFDSGCGAGPRARWLPDGSVEIEGEGVPVKPLPKDVAQWSGEIAKAAAKHGVPPQLVAGIMATESGGQPKVHSSCCFGLMGLLPTTASEQAGRTVGAGELVENPVLNIDLGTKLLAVKWKKYDGNVIRIAASYNAGSALCGVGKKCPAGSTPNRWNLIADCVNGKTVDYSGRAIGFLNAAVKSGVGSKVTSAGAPGVTGWSGWQLALGAVSLAVVGLAVLKPGVLRGAAGAFRANPDENLIRRAVNILQYASPEEAAEILVDEGTDPEDAYLAVRGGELLLKDREGRSQW